jgi:hypothetical protein
LGLPPNKKPSAEEQQIREMAKLSLMSNTINPIQEKNLKMFPFVFFNDLEKVKIDYDFTNNQMVDSEEIVNTEEDVKKGKEKLEIKYKFSPMDTRHFRVSYHLTLKENHDNAALDKRFSALEQSVRNLFWKETKIEVFLNGTLAYESKNV